MNEREKMLELGAFEPDIYRQGLNKSLQRSQGGEGGTGNTAGQGEALGGDFGKVARGVDRVTSAVAAPFEDAYDALSAQLGPSAKKLKGKIKSGVNTGLAQLGEMTAAPVAKYGVPDAPRFGQGVKDFMQAGSLAELTPPAQPQFDLTPEEQELMALKPASPSDVVTATPAPTEAAAVTPNSANVDLVNRGLERQEMREAEQWGNKEEMQRFYDRPQSPGDPNSPRGASFNNGPIIDPNPGQGSRSSTGLGDGSNGIGFVTPGIQAMSDEWRAKSAAMKAARNASGAGVPVDAFGQRMAARSARMSAENADFLKMRDAKNFASGVKRKDRAGIMKQMMGDSQKERESLRETALGYQRNDVAADRNSVARRGQDMSFAGDALDRDADYASDSTKQSAANMEFQRKIGNDRFDQAYKGATLGQKDATLAETRANNLRAERRAANQQRLGAFNAQTGANKASNSAMNSWVNSNFGMDKQTNPVAAWTQGLAMGIPPEVMRGRFTPEEYAQIEAAAGR